MGGVDEAVHRGVDRRRRAALAVQAEVEGGDHLVLPLLARVDVDEGAQPVEAQDGESVGGQRPEVAAGALDPQQLDVVAGDGVELGALGRRVAAGVVGVPWVGSEAVRSGEELLDDGVHVTPSLVDGGFDCRASLLMEVEDLVEGAHLLVGRGAALDEVRLHQRLPALVDRLRLHRRDGIVERAVGVSK